VLGVPYDVTWPLPLAGILVGAIGVALAGLLGTRRVVSSPPLATIRAVT
jgi:putative ABC transport system permease protein